MVADDYTRRPHTSGEEPAPDVADTRSPRDGPSGVPLMLPGLAQGQLEILVEGAGGDVPHFVTLGHGGKYGCLYRARIRSGTGATLRYLILKIQRDRYDDEDDAFAGHVPLPNPAIEELWGNEHRHLLEFAGTLQADAVLQYYPLPPAEATTQGLRVLPPIMFWAKKRLFFHPPCPRCGTVLRDCRDDQLLAERRLSPYSQTNRRYLVCPACAAKASGADREDLALYRSLPTEAEQACNVRSETDLYDDICSSGRDGTVWLPAVGRPGTHLEVAEQELSADQIISLSFYDCRVLPFEHLQLTYQEYASCLGGITWEDFISLHRPEMERDESSELARGIKGLLESRDRFLFGGRQNTSWALEIFRLKINLFAKVCQAMEAFHARLGKPHLNLRAENILVALPQTASGLAGMWNSAVKLSEVAVSSAFPYGEDEERRTALTKPPGAGTIYFPPFATDQQLARTHPCEMRARGLEEVQDGVYVLRMWIQPKDEVSVNTFTDKDLFHVMASGAPLRGRVSFFAFRRLKQAHNSLELQSVPTRLDPSEASVFQRYVDRPMRSASFRCYPVYDVPCDMYSLGMVLLGTLLAGRDQDLTAIRDRLITPVTRELRLERDRNPNVTPQGLTDAARKLLSEKEEARSYRIFQAQEPVTGTLLPDELWHDALLLGLRLATTIPGFSWCEDRSDFPSENPGSLLARLTADVGELERKAHVLLFGTVGMEDELSDVVDRLLRDMRGVTALGEDDRYVLEAVTKLEETLTALTGDFEGQRRDVVARRLEDELRSVTRDMSPAVAKGALEVLKATRREPLVPKRDTDADRLLEELRAENQLLQEKLEQTVRQLEQKDQILEPALRDLLLGPTDRRGRNPQDYDLRIESFLRSSGTILRASEILPALGEFAAKTSGNIQTLLREFGIRETIDLFHHAAFRILSEGRGGVGVGEYLEALRTALKIFTRAPLQVIRTWCSQLQEELRPERFLKQEGLLEVQRKARAWDSYQDFFRTVDLEEHILPRIKIHVEGEWRRVQQQLRRPRA